MTLINPFCSNERANEQDAMNCYNEFLKHEDQHTVNSCFRANHFDDVNIQRHYENFLIKNVSALYSIIWVSMFLIYLNFCIVSFTRYSDDMGTMRVLLMLRLAVGASGLFNYCMIFFMQVPPDVNRQQFHSFVNFVTNLSNFTVIAAALVNGAIYVWTSSLGSCLVRDSISEQCAFARPDDSYFFDCNPSYEFGGTPINSRVNLLIGNVFIMFSLCCHSSWATRVNHLVTFMACLVAAAVSRVPGQSVVVLLCELFLVIIYEGTEKNSLAVFKSLLLLEYTKRTQTAELKHFIGNVAHDLKTPLHGLSISLEQLITDAETMSRGEGTGAASAASMTRTMELCQATSYFMGAAINRTVDFAKAVSNGPLRPTLEPVSLPATLRWAVSLVQTQSLRAIQIVELPAGIGECVLTDKHWLMENMLCYVANAVKYSSGGVITIRVSLKSITASADRGGGDEEEGDGDGDVVCQEGSSTRASAMLCISVEDEGVGIADDQKESIFLPFQQTTRVAGGAGLGLYSVACRVEVLGGECGVANRSDGRMGSMFWLSIPYVTVADGTSSCRMDEGGSADCADLDRSGRERTSSGDEGTKVGASSSPAPTLSALIVEDSLVIAKTTKRMLSKAGYHVDVAENGAVGLDKMKTTVYDIVIMDLQMPVMDGVEATRRIRMHEQEAASGSPNQMEQTIIGVSANGADDIRESALASGMNAFVPKPFTISSLMELF